VLLFYNAKYTGRTTSTVGKYANSFAESSKEVCLEVYGHKHHTLLCSLPRKEGKGKVTLQQATKD
jgi:hypothetical protein